VAVLAPAALEVPAVPLPELADTLPVLATVHVKLVPLKLSVTPLPVA
jgi:hypothetical protein